MILLKEYITTLVELHINKDLLRYRHKLLDKLQLKDKDKEKIQKDTERTQSTIKIVNRYKKEVEDVLLHVLDLLSIKRNGSISQFEKYKISQYTKSTWYKIINELLQHKEYQDEFGINEELLIEDAKKILIEKVKERFSLKSIKLNNKDNE